jgi:Holliday junction resolvase RusA-like endonuclease
MNTTSVLYKAEIKGEAASKSNSRRMVSIGGKPRLIKSKKALDYSDAFRMQVKPLEHLIEEDVQVKIKIYYATRRPDLDESLILDLLQGVAYKNDRQVKRKLIEWGLDRVNPRCIIEITPLESGDNSSCERCRF